MAASSELYLPVEENPGPRTVAAAEQDDASILQFVRKLTGLRKESAALGAEGEFAPIHAKANSYPFVFERSWNKDRYWIAVNPSGVPARASWATTGEEADAMIVSDAELLLENGRAEVTLSAAGYGLWKIFGERF